MVHQRDLAQLHEDLLVEGSLPHVQHEVARLDNYERPAFLVHQLQSHVLDREFDSHGLLVGVHLHLRLAFKLLADQFYPLLRNLFFFPAQYDVRVSVI